MAKWAFFFSLLVFLVYMLTISTTGVYAASLWAAVKSFGYKTLPNNSNGANTHCLENVMAMDEGDKERLGGHRK